MSRVFTLLGFAFCILPPALSTLSFFPLWLAGGERSLSAIALILLTLCALPLFRFLKAHLRTPSAWMLWLALFLFLSLFRAIADGLWMISLVAFLGSLLGALCFFIAKHTRKG